MSDVIRRINKYWLDIFELSECNEEYYLFQSKLSATIDAHPHERTIRITANGLYMRTGRLLAY